jgi:putative PIN family toxin of toxin-antitoxin system
MRVIIDTNVLLAAVPRKSAYNWLVDALFKRKFEIAFSNEILSEYVEQFFIHWHPLMAEDVAGVLLEMYNAVFIDVHFHFNLIFEDPDDNKFVDCAVASSADYLVTFDKHFNILKQLDFPKITVVHPDEFRKILLDRKLIEP